MLLDWAKDCIKRRILPARRDCWVGNDPVFHQSSIIYPSIIIVLREKAKTIVAWVAQLIFMMFMMFMMFIDAHQRLKRLI